jgi:alpha-1,4-digalacturonate transport system permease protein
VAQRVDPKAPGAIIKVHITNRTPVQAISFATGNYTEPFIHFDFLRFLGNSVFVTTMATLITLVVNSMAAFALSKYRFRGQSVIMLIILATLMVPLGVIMVPLYSIISALGLFNNLWGVILPTVATPTGVFMLRQYMLTIPDELIDAARMDKASEWLIYWRIVLPLAAPALAVLAIFSVVWRWNDFLWPLIVLSRTDLYTLQVGLNVYAGQLNVQWQFILAMTVVTMIPVVLVFVFLQRFITTGIAGTGLK